MTNKIRHVGTLILLAIPAMGMILVLLVMIAYYSRVTVINQEFSEWLLQNASINIEQSEDLSEEERFLHKYLITVERYKEIIETFCTESFPENNKIHGIVSDFEVNILGINRNRIRYYDGEIPKDVLVAYECVCKLNDFLENTDIEFLYIEAPCKLRYLNKYESDDIESDGGLSIKDIEKEDLLLSMIEKDTISTLRLSDKDEMMRSLRFDNTSHWYSTSALSIMDDVCAKIYELDGMVYTGQRYNPQQFYNVLSKYTTTELGYTYNLPVPLGEFNFKMEDENSSYHTVDFKSRFLTEDSKWAEEVNVKRPYYNLWKQNNSTPIEIQNLNEDVEKKKILVLGDSFSWPVVAYLSMEFSDVYAFNPQYYGGDVKRFIDDYRPDVVIWFYFDGQINEQNVDRAYGFMD